MPNQVSKEPNKKQALLKQVLLWVGVFVFMAVFLKSVMIPFVVIMVLVLFTSSVAYPILYLLNRANGNRYAKKLSLAKLIFLRSILIFLFGFIIAVATYTPNAETKDTETQLSPTPTQIQAKKTSKGTEKPTPEPTEDCSQSVNPQMCIRMEINREPKLNATTQLTNAGLVVTNNDSADWRLCDVTIGSAENIDTAYEVSGWDIGFPAHQVTTIPWGNFTQDNGNRFNYYEREPQDIELDCSVNKEQEHLRIN